MDRQAETLVDLASKLYVSASSVYSTTSIDDSSTTRIDGTCQEGSVQGTLRTMLAAVLELEALHHRKQDRRKLAVHYRELAADRRAARARMAPVA